MNNEKAFDPQASVGREIKAHEMLSQSITQMTQTTSRLEILLDRITGSHNDRPSQLTTETCSDESCESIVVLLNSGAMRIQEHIKTQSNIINRIHELLFSTIK